MSLKRNIREYFTYSTTEKRGLLVLIVLVILVCVVPYFIPEKEAAPIDIITQKQIVSWIQTAQQQQEKSIRLYPFDPNTATEKQLLALGFTSYQAKNIIRYRNKGGVFRKKSDLAKIYGLTPETYQRYKNYISIPPRKKKAKKKKAFKAIKKPVFLSQFNPNTLSLWGWDSLGVDKKIAQRIQKYIAKGGKFRTPDDLSKIYGLKPTTFQRLKPYILIPKEAPKPIILIDLNKADTTSLKRINGIGSKLSARIVAYRKKIGGFVSKNQIKEVYGIAKRYKKIATQITIDTTNVVIRKIDINSASEWQLQKHPYITKRMAKDIVRYRKRRGNYSAIDDLKNKHLLPSAIYEKVKYYLRCDN